MARIIALCNQKGGVGKSTTTFHLARAAVRAGMRTLVVDGDPQGNLTQVVTADPVPEDAAGLADALSTRASETLADVVVDGVWDLLSVVPTTGLALAAVRDELVIAGAGREVRLREALRDVSGDYDLVLIDCAPSLDQLTINALTAADEVLVVTHSKLFSANGLAQLLEAIEGVRSYYNANLSFSGIVINQHEERTVSGHTWLAQLTDVAVSRGLRVLDPVVPKRVVISDALEAAQGLDQWGSKEANDLAEIYARHLDQIRSTAHTH